MPLQTSAPLPQGPFTRPDGSPSVPGADMQLLVGAVTEVRGRAVDTADRRLVHPRRYWDPTAQFWYWLDETGQKRQGRPPVPDGQTVDAFSELYLEATPPPDSVAGDGWYPHPVRLVDQTTA